MRLQYLILLCPTFLFSKHLDKEPLFLNPRHFNAVMMAVENTNPGVLETQDQEDEEDDSISTAFYNGLLSFSFDLKEKIHKEAENSIYSPLSIGTTLGMIGMGSANQTLVEINRVLRFKGSQNELGEDFRQLIQSLMEHQNGYPNLKLFLESVLWMQKDFQFLPLFQSEVVNDFFGDLRLVDFSKTENAVGEMNQWFFRKSFGNFSNFFSLHDVTPATKLIAVSTILLKATFEKPFDLAHTRVKPFYPQHDKKISIDTMYQKGIFNYYKGDQYEVVELNYLPLDKNLSLWIVLPKKADNFNGFVSSFSGVDFRAIHSNLKPASIELDLPKFNIESSLDLIPVLQAMGVREPFTPKSNFSLMTEANNLMISQFKHKALLTVEESGTIAAAATSATFVIKALPPTQDQVTFNVNHPFIFIIVDKKNKLPLFMGQVVEPKIVPQNKS